MVFNKLKPFWLAVSLFAAIGSARASEKPQLIGIAEQELFRSYESLKSGSVPVYYIAYGITDKVSYTLTGSFGSLKNEEKKKYRTVDIDLRVGDPKFDNTHIIRGNPFEFGSGSAYANLPIENNESAIRTAIWQATDRTYKDAIERYEKATTNQKVKVTEEDSSADFSSEPAREWYDAPKPVSFDTASFSAKVRRLSQKFDGINWLYEGSVYFTATNTGKYFVSTENNKIAEYDNAYRIFVSAMTKADDGMTLPLYKSYFSFTPEGLPSEAAIARDIDSMIVLLKRLRTAPTAETFTGPAILSGEAAGVFFHEIYGHRIEGHREKDPNASQTFKGSVGKKILPDFIDVTMDPTIKTYKGRELSGYYEYDDEGVKSQKVVTVERGVFRSFLMSRSPITNFEHSNGHGRRQAGYKAVSRQSNLIVDAEKTTTRDSLRLGLKKLAREQGKEYGLMFDVVTGGFTFTSRRIPNAFNVMPLVVYKVYADNRPDELVRGVDLIGTPLTTFSNIVAAADDFGVFNGICGAESGGVPVSACSPSLLVSSIEVQKKQKSQAKLPILDAPIQTVKQLP